MQPTQGTDFTLGEVVLAVSLELAKGSWKMALHDGRREKAALHTVSPKQAAGRLAEAVAVIEETKRKWGLGAEVRVVGCWESVEGDFVQRLAQGAVVCHDGSALPVQ